MPRSDVKQLPRLVIAAGIACATLATSALSAMAVTSIGTDIATDGLLSVAGTATLGDAVTDTAVVNGMLGVNTTTPGVALAVRDTAPSPTSNIFQISNLNDSTRYFTVSSTATIVSNLTVNGTCTGCSTSTNLNQAYLSSTSTGAFPELSITPSLGALTLADTMSGTGNVFEIQNRTSAAGAYSQRYFTVSATAVGVFSNAPYATLTIDHQNYTGGYALGIRLNGTDLFTVDYQGSIVGQRALTISRSAVIAEQADQYWDYPALAITPFSDFNDNLISATIGGSPRLTLTYTGQLGILTSSPSAEIDVRDSASVPTTNILQVANLDDSTRYFTVSSTSTLINTDLNLEDGTGSVSANAVTINAVSGVITDTTDIAAATTRAAITFTNSRLLTTSVVTVSQCSTPDAGAMIVAAVTPGAGSGTITVRNVGASNQTSDWKLCYRINN